MYRFVSIPAVFFRLFPISFMSFWLLAGCGGKSGAGLTAVFPTCEHVSEPYGVEALAPRLSWSFDAAGRGEHQTAYRVIVASDSSLLAMEQGDLWDSGKVVSSRNVLVPYDGAPLESRRRCWWKVRAWGADGSPGPWSEASYWEMGLLDSGEWEADWISNAAAGPPPEDEPAPLFRTEFTVTRPIAAARAYISGVGYYELSINGEPSGTRVLDPAFTNYTKRVLYTVHDITDMLVSGTNVVGVELGNGWYNMHTLGVWEFERAPWRGRPALRCQIEVTYADGGSEIVAASGSGWLVSSGPTVWNCIRNGSVYDARLEQPGWNDAGFDDSSWARAVRVAGPAGELHAQIMPPVRVTGTVSPARILHPSDGVYVFDFGRNIAGWARLQISAPPGTEITLKYGERLAPDNTLDREDTSRFIMEGPVQTDRYICSGNGTEVWEPKFAYFGFQYVEVTGLPGEPSHDMLAGRVVHTDFEAAGEFKCANELFNDIQRCTRWSFVNNYHGYPTDCPQREKNGWTGDALIAAETGLFNFDVMAAYTKWFADIRDAQKSNGALPGIVPTSGWGYTIKWRDDPDGMGPAWDSACILMPWYAYVYRGDRRVLSENYRTMKRYIDFMISKADGHILDIGLEDWAPANTTTPRAVTSTGYFYIDALIMSRIAAVLGNEADAGRYASLAEEIRRAFNDTFYNAGDGTYANGSQTSQSCALYWGLADPENTDRVLQVLLADIEGKGRHLDAGILGTKYLMNILTEHGRADVAYAIANQRDFPSWGHWIEQGATTLWEQWDGSGSHNHIMFGDIGAWFIKTLGGINPDPDQPGFAHVIISPHPVGGLKWARAAYRSPNGMVETSWRMEEGGFSLDVTIPPNSTATVHIPAADANNVMEGGVPAGTAVGVTFLSMAGGAATYEVQSGVYSFSVQE